MALFGNTNPNYVFNSLTNPKDENEEKEVLYKSKVSQMYSHNETEAPRVGVVSKLNPFVKKDGSLINKHIDYRSLIDRDDINSQIKSWISQATGLSPTLSVKSEASSVQDAGFTPDTPSGGYNGASWNVNSSDGVFKNNELMNIIQSVSAETGVPTNVLLAVAQQETGGKWYDKVSDGTGYSYGYMMLYDNGVIADLKAKGKGDLAEKAKTDPYTNVSVGAQYLKQFYDQYGSWEKAAARYNGAGTAAQNYGSTVWGRANSDAYLNAFKNPVSAKTATSSMGSKLVDVASAYLGTPYVWGGDALEKGGLDCSGFVYRALNDAGYKIGRTTAQGYRSGGQVVSKAEMLPGDLVFYGKGNNASHIGIYIGDGKVMHSSGGQSNTASNPGKGVTVSNVDYRSDFIEARRY